MTADADRRNALTEFRNKTDEYWIVCPDCCCFKQRASKHLAGQGCNTCNLSSAMKERRITQDEYIQRCKEQHKEKYYTKKEMYSVALNNGLIDKDKQINTLKLCKILQQ